MRVVWLQESHKTKVIFVIKKGHHINKKRKKTIPRTLEALCSLEMFCTDFFPTVDILRLRILSLELGRVLPLWELSSIATFSGDEQGVSLEFWKTVDTASHVRR